MEDQISLMEITDPVKEVYPLFHKGQTIYIRELDIVKTVVLSGNMWMVKPRQNSGSQMPYYGYGYEGGVLYDADLGDRVLHDVTADSFRERTGLHTVNLISGGFPCQPFSVAGKQKGKGDDRYLWPEMLRVIRELAPRWVLCENVSGIIQIAGRTVCEDLEREGYSVAVFNYEAAAVGAPHRRERVFFVGERVTENSCDVGCWQPRILPKQSGRTEFIGASKNMPDWGTAEMSTDVAYSNSERQQQPRGFEREVGKRFGDGCQDVAYAACELLQESVCTDETRITGFTNVRHVSDTDNAGLQIAGHESRHETLSSENRIELRDWWAVEPGLGGTILDGIPRWLDEPEGVPRIATGIKNRTDRLKCLGNAVVPAQVYPILKAIMEVELCQIKIQEQD